MSGFAALNAFTPAVLEPVVSLPVQNVMSPLALSIDAGSMTLAPSIAGPESPPPPVGVDPPESESSPHGDDQEQGQQEQRDERASKMHVGLLHRMSSGAYPA